MRYGQHFSNFHCQLFVWFWLNGCSGNRVKSLKLKKHKYFSLALKTKLFEPHSCRENREANRRTCSLDWDKQNNIITGIYGMVHKIKIIFFCSPQETWKIVLILFFVFYCVDFTCCFYCIFFILWSVHEFQEMRF